MSYQICKENFYLPFAKDVQYAELEKEFYSKILSITPINFKIIFEEIYDVVTYEFKFLFDLDKICSRPNIFGQSILQNRNEYTFKYDECTYQGTILHHVIFSALIPTANLTFIFAVLLACGANFDKEKDSNGCSARYCLSLYRYEDVKLLKESLSLSDQLLKSNIALKNFNISLIDNTDKK